MKDKNGFTLIELLAVIIILGVLMIIAIPSVTKYIDDSRKNGYVSTAKSIVGGARNLVYSGDLEFDDFDTTYYIDAKCISTDNAYKSPYGDFVKAYIVVTAANDNYEYFWTSVDDAGRGVKELININELDIDNIETDIKENDISILRTIDGRGKVIQITEENNCQKGSTITNNLIEVNTDPLNASYIINSVSGLVNVSGANRFVGSSPNNYVSFNNELWRIIGVYGNNLKIIKSDPLSSSKEYYSSSPEGDISWEDSSIKTYLNETYYNSLLETAKNKIDNKTWNIGYAGSGLNSIEAYSNAQTKTWNGKVGLLASYEYLSAGNSNCYETQGYSYGSTCASNNWINVQYLIEWTITLENNSSENVLSIWGDGNMQSSGIYTLLEFRPAVYLKSSTKIISGTGTSIDPYILG